MPAFVVDGLRSFARALKVVDQEFPKELKEANFEAARTLRDLSRVRAEREGKQARKAARSIRALRGARYAAVSFGGATYPFAFGAEFGAKRMTQGRKLRDGARGPRKHIGGFPDWRGNQWGGWSGGPGYIIHPTLRLEGPAIIRQWWARIDRLTDKAFPD